jgi:hypothetical protein
LFFVKEEKSAVEYFYSLTLITNIMPAKKKAVRKTAKKAAKKTTKKAAKKTAKKATKRKAAKRA